MTTTEEAGVGHNSVNEETRAQIKSFVERIQRLEEEKQTLADDIKDVKGEAKAAGYDMKTLAEMLKLLKMDVNERSEREALRDTYASALGVFG